MSLFTQFKQWIQLKPSAAVTGTGQGSGGAASGFDAKASLGAYFERVSGGEVSYSMAEAAQANSRGMVYRTTRFRISELSLENYLELDVFQNFCAVFESFRKNGNEKMSVVRVIKNGSGEALTYEYTGCSVIQPPSIDDGDVARDSEFLMMRIRLQPEAVKVTRGQTLLMQFSPYDGLDGAEYEKGTA